MSRRGLLGHVIRQFVVGDYMRGFGVGIFGSGPGWCVAAPSFRRVFRGGVCLSILLLLLSAGLAGDVTERRLAVLRSGESDQEANGSQNYKGFLHGESSRHRAGAS